MTFPASWMIIMNATTVIERILAFKSYPAADEFGPSLSAQIIRILSGSRQIRVGDCLTHDQAKFAMTEVDACIAEGKPIPVSTCWGAAKGYGVICNCLAADAYDLMAFVQLSNISKAVREIYSPGVEFRIILEDIGETFLTTIPNHVSQNVAVYCDSLQRHLDIFGITGVHLQRESSFLLAKGLTEKACFQQATAYSSLFHHYWMASLHVLTEERRIQLPEYADLAKIGWKGAIPDVMREHYLSRAFTEWNNPDEHFLGHKVCKYLGMAFFRRSMGMHSKLTLSYVPYPPGAPPSLGMGRFQYRAKASKNCKTSTPPWCGFYELGQCEGHILGVRDLRTGCFESVQTEYNGSTVTLGVQLRH